MNDNCYLLKTSYCVILGMTGHGKSTFINAITNSKSCKTSNKGSSKTKYINCIDFREYNHIFKIFDTPGLGDSENNEKTINIVINILYKERFVYLISIFSLVLSVIVLPDLIYLNVVKS